MGQEKCGFVLGGAGEFCVVWVVKVMDTGKGDGCCKWMCLCSAAKGV